MNLLEMYKKLSDDEKDEFIKLIINEINKMTTKNDSQIINF